MQHVEKTISNLVESQFPAFYQEEGPRFVEFVKTYYEWLEEESVLYHARRLLDYHDIDSTIDEFLIHFKNKYLNSIQFDTAVDTRRMVKHSLDLYRSKGTERSLDLFFKNIFGVPADVYYPGDDVFKLSDGTWILPRYLELFDSDNIKSFIGLQIEGITSGATAFVEKYVKKRSRNSGFYTHLYYINNIVGQFDSGERIRATSSGEVGPIIRGSVHTATVLSGSIGYEVGDIVDLVSAKNGIDAKARVSEVSSQTGKLSFTLVNGGWGYNANSQVLIAEKMLRIENVTYDGSNFDRFETVAQPLANVGYTNLVNGPIEVGDTLSKVDPSTGLVYTEGKVLSVDVTNSSAGFVRLAVTTGKPDTQFDITTEDDYSILYEDGIGMVTDGVPLTEDGAIYRFSRVSTEDGLDLLDEDGSLMVIEEAELTANIVSFNDITAYGNVIRWSSNLTFTAALNNPTPFANGEVVVATDAGNNQIGYGTVASSGYEGSNVSINIINYVGRFDVGRNVFGNTSGASANLSNISTVIGVVDVINEFFESDDNLLIGLTSNVQSSINNIGTGTGGAIIITDFFLNEETFSVSTDQIEAYVDVELDSPDYGFPAPGAENSNTIIGDAFTFANVTAGKIASIVVTNSGDDYDTAPFVVIYDPLMYSFGKRDYIINIANTSGTLAVGEVLTQNGAPRGIVKVSNGEIVHVERIAFTDLLVGPISGETTSATADITNVLVDTTSEYIGINANVISNTAVSTGSVVSLEIVDSGFAYDDLENVTFTLDGHQDGTAEIDIDSYGTGQGYWEDNNSELSANKKIHDGDYYQEFSYEIQSSVVLEDYVDILKSIMHMAGTRYFARYILETTAPSTVESTSEMTVS